jgi:transcriptional regulator with XRE-family HTH domain
VETIGQRILRLRKGKGWKRPELGRRMAVALGRAKPFAGETIRQYELGNTDPGKDARRALARVFDRAETYIEFGDPGQAATKAQQPTAAHDEADRARDTREEILLYLYRGLFGLQQERLIVGLRAMFHANQFTRKELGQKPLRGVSDEQVRKAFGDAPFHRMKRIAKKDPPASRDLGTAMDDFFEE